MSKTHYKLFLLRNYLKSVYVHHSAIAIVSGLICLIIQNKENNFKKILFARFSNDHFINVQLFEHVKPDLYNFFGEQL